MDLAPAEALIASVMVAVMLLAGLSAMEPRWHGSKQLALGLAGSLTPLATEYLESDMELEDLRSRAGRWLQPYEMEMRLEGGVKLVYMLGGFRCELEAKPSPRRVEANAMLPVQLPRGQLKGFAIPYRRAFYARDWLEVYLAFMFERGEPAPPALKVEATLLDSRGRPVAMLGATPVDMSYTLYRVRWLIPEELSPGRYELRSTYTGPGGLWAEASAELMVAAGMPPSLSELIPVRWWWRLGEKCELTVTKPGVAFSVKHSLKGRYVSGRAEGTVVGFSFTSPVNLAPGVYVVEAAGCRVPVVLLPFPAYVLIEVGS